MEKLKSLISCEKAANWNVEVNGRKTRVLKCMWSVAKADDELAGLSVVGDMDSYAGNLSVDESWGEDIAAIKQRIETLIDSDKLCMYAYQFSARVVSEGAFVAYSSGDATKLPIETFRRAWPHDNDGERLLNVIKAQTAKAVLGNKLHGVPA